MLDFTQNTIVSSSKYTVLLIAWPWQQRTLTVAFFNEFQRTLKQVCYFYINAAVCYNSLRDLQHVLDDNPSLRTVTLKKPASFRWLSLHQAIKDVYNVYPALCLQLDQEAAAKGAADAKGIL